jgi:ribosomal protein S2
MFWIAGLMNGDNKREWTMNRTIFEELRTLKRNNEFREVLLMRAAKKMLADKKKKSRLQKMFEGSKKVKTIPKVWD